MGNIVLGRDKPEKAGYYVWQDVCCQFEPTIVYVAPLDGSGPLFASTVPGRPNVSVMDGMWSDPIEIEMQT